MSAPADDSRAAAAPPMTLVIRVMEGMQHAHRLIDLPSELTTGGHASIRPRRRIQLQAVYHLVP
jgi:hypothetical protein